MEIVEHLSSIGYVLFHQRSIIGQHLFATKGECKVTSSVDIEKDRYMNIKNQEIYLSIDLEISVELNASSLDSTKKEFTSQTKNDAQYASVNDLVKE